MLEALRKAVPITIAPAAIDVVVAVGTVATFLWLLAQGFIRPLAVYLLELFLAI